MFDYFFITLSLCITALILIMFFLYVLYQRRQIAELAEIYDRIIKRAEKQAKAADDEVDKQVSIAYITAFKHAKYLLRRMF